MHPSDLRITNVALGDELADNEGRTSLKLTYHPAGSDESDDEDEEESNEDEDTEPVTTVLCSLTPGKVCFDRLYTPGNAANISLID